MTVMVDQGLVTLTGRCAAEDAEQLLVALLEQPERIVDLSNAARLHTAVVQVLLAIKPSLRGTPQDPFLREFIFPDGALE